MIQLDLEQRQSSRFSREFLVTDYEDHRFAEPFEGHDVNLTGLSFWVRQPDLFFPQQLLSLRIKNIHTDETYCLEGVEIVHQREDGGEYLCGCHIAQVTSSQLLAHHRIVMSDANSALISMQDSHISEFNFVEDGSPLSTDQADYQEAGMALNLAVSQMQSGRQLGEALLDDMQQCLNNLQGESLKSELGRQFERFSEAYQEMTETTVALGMLAKLLAHTPDQSQDRQAWKTMIADFENRFLTEQQQIAYDFMHQGMNAEEALKVAERYLKEG
ncbi:MAG: PilZ domain-containing protein [Thiomicrorhabdus chilensis]|uniref:PilZ domain-containing protein n=1 Tax=Thiomicrorhabdus chilensis TaxID=63656 RepID=UPI00299D15C4|nr:PilZ domain-containing protein [Thiomicrorhabdus chilensis]MDX1347010.1 PilZ domain-containing protein [Thiomicrorhabdus chilensis]